MNAPAVTKRKPRALSRNDRFIRRLIAFVILKQARLYPRV